MEVTVKMWISTTAVCAVCGKRADGAIYIFKNLTTEPLETSKIIPVTCYYCEEHAPKDENKE